MTDGQAVGFFDCNASAQQLRAELPSILRMTRAPSSLELRLVEGPENAQGDKQTEALGREAANAGIRYALQARLPGANNKRTVGEVTTTLNQAYQTQLYEEGEQFRGGAFYQDNNSEEYYSVE